MIPGYIAPEFELVRDDAACTRCRLCERECANGAHGFNDRQKRMTADNAKCVNCQRCVAICPTHALRIVKKQPHLPREYELVKRCDQRNLPPGRDGRRAAFFDGQPKAPARILGPASHQCLTGDESLHRPAARAYGNTRVPRQKAGPY